MKYLSKKQILTIPNLLSLFRLLLIPVIWVLYQQGLYIWALWVTALSALTDVVDGRIARRYNMVSDFGKILDPIADKLTQLALMLCLMKRYPFFMAVIFLFVAKEAIMLIFGCITLVTKDQVNSSKWYGKLSTVVLYGVMMYLLLFPGTAAMTARILCWICGGIMLLALILYLRFYIALLSKSGSRQASNSAFIAEGSPHE